jgi:hypothetical protein
VSLIAPANREAVSFELCNISFQASIQVTSATLLTTFVSHHPVNLSAQ